ncbi:Hypothetical predicted protein [Cloeon dipterum]|uniref:Uncharacterized protein n=1 Tax=Cloeon dipterum TaxID=197152 RepID=A0A8S1D296_9INSE|nr:Hypothetical predicted protein [Cloeon dipterum]
MTGDSSPVAQEKKGSDRSSKKDVGIEKKDPPTADMKRDRTPAEKSEEKSGPPPAKRGRETPKGSKGAANRVQKQWFPIIPRLRFTGGPKRRYRRKAVLPLSAALR